MAPVARGLADRFRVFEPLQRGSGSVPLTVARHVDDLLEIVRSHCGGVRPALVGSSWGAMLALAYAAAHPDEAGPLVLIGCGTFDLASRRRMQQTLDERIDLALKKRIDHLRDDVSDPDQRLTQLVELLLPVYSHDLAATDPPDDSLACDAIAYQETWDDMVRLQTDGIYPAAFAAIHSPILMLHGAADPHPGKMICASLRPLLPQIEYIEWDRCGHYPWSEKAVRPEFLPSCVAGLSSTYGQARDLEAALLDFFSDSLEGGHGCGMCLLPAEGRCRKEGHRWVGPGTHPRIEIRGETGRNSERDRVRLLTVHGDSARTQPLFHEPKRQREESNAFADQR